MVFVFLWIYLVFSALVFALSSSRGEYSILDTKLLDIDYIPGKQVWGVTADRVVGEYTLGIGPIQFTVWL